LERLFEIGVRDVFAIAGDVDLAAGKFDGATALLAAMAELGHGIDEVGISGYPESHPFISDETTIQVMFDKERFATYIVSQLCLDAGVIAWWIGAVRARGVQLPIHIGIPGPIGRRKLLRIATRIGVGESTRFVRGHGGLLTRLFLRGRYGPGWLIERLAPELADLASAIGGFHVYTFNELATTERWRREALRSPWRRRPSCARAKGRTQTALRPSARARARAPAGAGLPRLPSRPRSIPAGPPGQPSRRSRRVDSVPARSYP